MFSVSITDDHELIRNGIRLMLDGNARIKITGEFSSAWELLESIQKNNYDLHIIDLNMPGISGVDAIKFIKQKTPAVKVLALSQYPKEVLGNVALNAGANEYLEKFSPVADIVATLERILFSDDSFFSAMGAAEAAEPSKVNHLSKREVEVFKLTAKGKTNSDIARQLNISVKTVNTYRARAKEKLNLKSAREILSYCTDKNLIDLLQNGGES